MRHAVVSALLSMVVVTGFTAMWLVANELEDPFGEDANDLDVVGFHQQFVDKLEFLRDSS